MRSEQIRRRTDFWFWFTPVHENFRTQSTFPKTQKTNPKTQNRFVGLFIFFGLFLCVLGKVELIAEDFADRFEESVTPNLSAPSIFFDSGDERFPSSSLLAMSWDGEGWKVGRVQCLTISPLR